ncbi:MAG: metal ABC transporter permease [Actinobacteria bacterium]|nr:metal ABC transporter permease [Actinomycetota bacterium]
MWSLPFMVNAFRAGTLVAVLAALAGYFVVLRRQTFAAHTLSVVGFPGATAAAWLGWSVTGGYLAASVAAAAVFALRPRATGRRQRAESAVIGTAAAFALACGFLFSTRSQGSVDGTTALLFGSVLGISTGQVVTLTWLAVVVLVLLTVVARPLLFGSLDPVVARAGGVPVRLLDAGFLVTLGAVIAMTAQITGALLVFALLVLPAATAQRLTARPLRAALVAVAIAVATTWVALTATFYTPYPVGFWLADLAFAGFVLATGVGAVRGRWHRSGRVAAVPAMVVGGTP